MTDHFIQKFPNEEVFLAWIRKRICDGLLNPLYVNGYIVSKMVVSTITTAGAHTYTPAELLGGIIKRDPTGAARNDVLPDAADLAAAIPFLEIGCGFEFTITNDGSGAETITLTTGTGVTISGTATIVINCTKRFRVVFTSLTAYTVYSLGVTVT